MEKMKKAWLVSLLAGVLVFSGLSLAFAAAGGEPMSNKRAVSLMCQVLGLKLPANAYEEFSEQALYDVQAAMLAKEGFNIFVDAKMDDLVNKATLATVLYTAVTGSSDVTEEGAIDYLSKLGVITPGSPKDTIFLRLDRPEAAEVMTNEQLAKVLSRIMKFDIPNADKLSREELYEIQAKKLAENCTTQFLSSDLDDLVTKGTIADVLYNKLFGCTNAPLEEKAAYFAKLGLMDEGGILDPVSLGLKEVLEPYGAPEVAAPPPANPPPPEPASRI